MTRLATMLPAPLKRLLRPIHRRLFDRPRRRAVITQPTGRLPVGSGAATLVIAVGPRFNQNVPNAYMTARLGYGHAFEALGVPYVLTDLHDLPRTLAAVPRPIVFLVGADYQHPWVNRATLAALRRHPHFVWVDPWFDGSDAFFAEHGMDAGAWSWPDWQRRKVLDGQPAFVFTGTVPSGLNFFEQWQRRGVRTVSLPLACDTTLYTPAPAHGAPARRPEFEGVRLAFVGGYWASKGRQLDAYLRPFEDELTIYGYSAWPYRGYRGGLPRDAEPALYRQGLVCPTVNEPTVRLLKGQINERVFKVLGCGGMTVVDAVPAYRELFAEGELLVPTDAGEFVWLVRKLLDNESLRRQWSRRGHAAVMARHTYAHRVGTVLELLGLESLANGPRPAPPMRTAA